MRIYMQYMYTCQHEHVHAHKHIRTLLVQSAAPQCNSVDLVTFDNDYIISHQKNWQLEWRTRSACIFEAHAPANVDKHTQHTYSIPPHGVSQWANEPMSQCTFDYRIMWSGLPGGEGRTINKPNWNKMRRKMFAASFRFAFLCGCGCCCCFWRCCCYFQIKPIRLRCSLWKHIAMK